MDRVLLEFIWKPPLAAAMLMLPLADKPNEPLVAASPTLPTAFISMSFSAEERLIPAPAVKLISPLLPSLVITTGPLCADTLMAEEPVIETAWPAPLCIVIPPASCAVNLGSLCWLMINAAALPASNSMLPLPPKVERASPFIMILKSASSFVSATLLTPSERLIVASCELDPAVTDSAAFACGEYTSMARAPMTAGPPTMKSPLVVMAPLLPMVTCCSTTPECAVSNAMKLSIVEASVVQSASVPTVTRPATWGFCPIDACLNATDERVSAPPAPLLVRWTMSSKLPARPVACTSMVAAGLVVPTPTRFSTSSTKSVSVLTVSEPCTFASPATSRSYSGAEVLMPTLCEVVFTCSVCGSSGLPIDVCW